MVLGISKLEIAVVFKGEIPAEMIENWHWIYQALFILITLFGSSPKWVIPFALVLHDYKELCS